MSKWIYVGIVLCVFSLAIPLILLSADQTDSTASSNSVIHAAAQNGEFGAIRAAIESGVDVNVRDEYGKTPLHYAAEHGHSQTSASLIEHGADPSVLDVAGHTPLDLAKQNQHEQTASVFVTLAPNPL